MKAFYKSVNIVRTNTETVTLFSVIIFVWKSLLSYQYNIRKILFPSRGVINLTQMG